MKTEIIHSKTTLYRSEKRPDVVTKEEVFTDCIAWADANPHVWQIVTGTKSKAYGRGSCIYIGWAQRSMAPEAILERAKHFHDLVTGNEPFLSQSHITLWRARFTFEHYREKGFTGGFFQQHDEKYPRLCLSLDYTPDTLEEVIDRFYAWCRHDYKTAHITLNKKIVRECGGKVNG